MNHIFTRVLIGLLVFVGIISCKQKENPQPGIALDARYAQIAGFETLANCRGPKGNYTTKMESDTTGNCFFAQVYTYNNTPFHALLTSDTTGYVVDEQKNIQDTLPQEVIEMIKSHDFHRLLSRPEQFFTRITFMQKLAPPVELYQAKDGLGNPAKLYYNTSKHLIAKVELLNPMDTTQRIEIINKKWMESAYGKMVKELAIIQAKKDTFYFNFAQVKLKPSKD